jgi:hypothetical protein
MRFEDIKDNTYYLCNMGQLYGMQIVLVLEKFDVDWQGNAGGETIFYYVKIGDEEIRSATHSSMLYELTTHNLKRHKIKTNCWNCKRGLIEDMRNVKVCGHCYRLICNHDDACMCNHPNHEYYRLKYNHQAPRTTVLKSYQ